MGISILIVLICMGNSIRIQKVKPYVNHITPHGGDISNFTIIKVVFFYIFSLKLTGIVHKRFNITISMDSQKNIAF